MNRRKLILAMLLVLLFAVILYQAIHLKDLVFKEDISTKRESFLRDKNLYRRLDEVQLPRINLNMLKERELLPQPSGRNLFCFIQEDYTQEQEIAEQKTKVEEPSPNLMEEVMLAQKQKIIPQKLVNARFNGFAEVKGIRVAGIIIDDDLYLGVEGDVIANRFIILEISNEYLEIGIPETEQIHRLPIEY